MIGPETTKWAQPNTVSLLMAWIWGSRMHIRRQTRHTGRLSSAARDGRQEEKVPAESYARIMLRG